MDIEYGINDLKNTPLWRLIQERINSDNLKWEDGIVGDDAKGNRLIQEVYYSTGKGVRAASKLLLKTTGLVEGEVR